MKNTMTMTGLGLGLLSVVALSACGTTEAGSNDDESSGEEIVLTDSRDKEITLDGPAEDVVALEWKEAEILTSLGVDPVGVAGMDGYQTWAGAIEPLDEDVTTDVGTRKEPSEDAIAKLNPDLVVAEMRNEELVNKLEEFVPVLVTEGNTEDDPLGSTARDVERIATATGTEDAAEELLNDVDERIDEVTQAISESDNADVPFLLADGHVQDSAVTVRLFTERSNLGAVAKAVGLENAWDGESDGQWGLSNTDVESLAEFKDNDLIFMHSNSDNSNIYTEVLSDNDIWASLEFVQNDRLEELPHGTWTFGGPAATLHFLDVLEEIYVG
ncbi:iron-siderophore ABC transporter substrate-binding protein [Haloglycomyces albus]|uniref:ABC transporter substrate-binding protein n=1 Tax=Haloglycomyces albus TaxID=526067 RepID=UPI00046D3A69|nr:iron-siderophore ABC transporter substrate-binding protein [Haloglycomyces albus]